MTRALDALVAERVMGYTRQKGQDEDISGRRYAYSYWEHETEEWFLSETEIPKYSTDIAAAWSVVEELHTRDAHVELSNYLADPSEKWACFISHEIPNMAGGCDWGGQSYAATAPLAICLAALRAVGVDEAEIQAAMGVGDG